MSDGPVRAAIDAQAPWLNVARALAAWMVCFAHLRAFFLVDFEQSGSGPLGSLFYFATGLHHQAVMIFFVLSGYFVGGALLREAQRGPIDFRLYALKRATRLWMVLVPALLLTLLWDRLGMALAGSAAYDGAYAAILSSGPTPDAPADHSLISFLGNVFFLQTIFVPSYGSNGPLWSLAYEGWYYLLFPLAVQVFMARAVWTKITCAFLLAGFLAVLLIWQPAIVVLGLNWLFGVAVYWLGRQRGIAAVTQNRIWRLGTLGLFAITLAASRLGLWPGHDLLVGLAFALVVTWLGDAAMAGTMARKAAYAGADFSYTLYLTHFPLLGLLFFTCANGEQLPFTWQSLAILMALFALCLAFAWLVWWVFERNTALVRNRIAQVFGADR